MINYDYIIEKMIKDKCKVSLLADEEVVIDVPLQKKLLFQKDTLKGKKITHWLISNEQNQSLFKGEINSLTIENMKTLDSLSFNFNIGWA